MSFSHEYATIIYEYDELNIYEFLCTWLVIQTGDITSIFRKKKLFFFSYLLCILRKFQEVLFHGLNRCAFGLLPTAVLVKAL